MLRVSTALLAGMLLAGCGSRGDEFSDRAGLEVSSDGTAKPESGIRSLITGQVAFHIRDGFKLRDDRVIPDAGSVIILQRGSASMCVKSKRDDFYQCGYAVPITVDGSGLSFALSTDGRIIGILGVVPGSLSSSDGSVEIPGGAVRFMTAGKLPDGSFEPSTLGNFRIEYFPRDELSDEKFLDPNGVQLQL